MTPKESNLIEIQRSRPARNKAVYKAVVPRDLGSISGFTESSIVVSELGSTSQPLYYERQHFRKV